MRCLFPFPGLLEFMRSSVVQTSHQSYLRQGLRPESWAATWVNITWSGLNPLVPTPSGSPICRKRGFHSVC